MITVKFNLIKGVLETKFSGEVTVDQIIDYIKSAKDSSSFPRFLKVLTDATAAEMAFQGDDLMKIVEANNQFLANYEAIIDAIVIDTPRETALSLLYGELSKSHKYRFKVFSTREAAIDWLESITSL